MSLFSRHENLSPLSVLFETSEERLRNISVSMKLFISLSPSKLIRVSRQKIIFILKTRSRFYFYIVLC